MSENWICRTFGCAIYDLERRCTRCGLPLYEEDPGWFYPLKWRINKAWGHIYWFFVGNFPFKRCPQCRKWIKKSQDFCSDECENEWIPFQRIENEQDDVRNDEDG